MFDPGLLSLDLGDPMSLGRLNVKRVLKETEAKPDPLGSKSNDWLVQRIRSLEAEVECQKVQIENLLNRRDDITPKQAKAQRDRIRKELAERQEQIDGLTSAESLFAEKAEERGWLVYRSGWPDFLCKDVRDDRHIAVEVKGPTDKLRDSQLQMFTQLDALGINVKIFRPGHDKLYDWTLDGLSVEQSAACFGSLRRSTKRNTTTKRLSGVADLSASSGASYPEGVSTPTGGSVKARSL